MLAKYLYSNSVTRAVQFIPHSTASFAWSERRGGSYKDFKKFKGSVGRDQSGADRAEYEQEIQKRRNTKLNWGIQNRWE